MSKVGLKALSETLGLSVGTVSRALNNYSDISQATRKRVREEADRLGYRPNTSARRLAKGSAECIGYILPWREGHISNPFLSELLDGLSSVVSERQWDLLVSAPKSAEDEIQLLDRIARSGLVSGLVISRTMVRDPRIEKLQQLNIPFVVHGRTATCDDYSWFDIDGRAAFRTAVTHLGGLGHQRIALIGGNPDYNFAAERRLGYIEGLQDLTIPYDSVLETVSDMTDAGGYQAMRTLLALADVPTAVVCLSDMVALGAMKAIHETGRMPGRDISIIGYDGLRFGPYSHPALTTMKQPLQAAGRKIGEMLLALIDGDHHTSHQELWQAELICRETDNPPLS